MSDITFAVYPNVIQAIKDGNDYGVFPQIENKHALCWRLEGDAIVFHTYTPDGMKGKPFLASEEMMSELMRQKTAATKKEIKMKMCDTMASMFEN